MIEGGSGTNIVPEKCIVKGEIRSYSHEKATRCVEEVGNTFKKVAEKHGAESELTCEVHLIAYETAKDSVPVKRFERVSKKLGLAGNLAEVTTTALRRTGFLDWCCQMECTRHIR